MTVAQAADPLNIWYVNPLPNTPDWGRSGKLFQDQAAALGYRATMVGPTKIDVPAMVSAIEQAIADKADGIITCVLDPAAFKGVVDEAKAAGIIVASIGCVDPNADFSVGTGNEAYGKLSADLINEQTGGKAQVGIVGTDQTSPNQVAQVKGFREQVKASYPDIKELAWEGDNSDAGIAAQKIGALVAAYPELNYLWIIEGAAPGAVPAALSEAGKQAGDIKVLAVDAQDFDPQGHRGRLDHRDAQPVLVRRLGQYRPADGGDEDLRQESRILLRDPGRSGHQGSPALHRMPAGERLQAVRVLTRWHRRLPRAVRWPGSRYPTRSGPGFASRSSRASWRWASG